MNNEFWAIISQISWDHSYVMCWVSADIAIQKLYNNKESGLQYKIGCDGNASSDIPITATSRYMMGIKQREKTKLQMFSLRR